MNDLTIYDTFAESWWQDGSPLHLLARLNPARFAYFDPLVRHWRAGACSMWDVAGDWQWRVWCSAAPGSWGWTCRGRLLHVAARQTRRPGCPAAVFTCGQAEALPFADASFEVVWCTDVLGTSRGSPGGDRADRPWAETRRALLVRYD